MDSQSEYGQDWMQAATSIPLPTKRLGLRDGETVLGPRAIETVELSSKAWRKMEWDREIFM